ncbi:MAG: DUF1254 domain-containing protein [Pseudomonadota bacterium]
MRPIIDRRDRTAAPKPRARAAALGAALAIALAPHAATGQPAPPAAAAQDARAREELAYAYALQAYVFTFPLIITERERLRRERLTAPTPGEPAAPINQLGHMSWLAGARGDLPYSPNSDTVYTGVALDLSGGPIILRMPEIRDRYVSVQVTDAYIENQPYLYSTRVNGGRATDIAFVGPGWTGDLPAGVVAARMPTNLSSIAVRIAVNGEADLPAVRRYQAAMSLTALADWRGGPSSAPPPAPAPRARTTYSGDFAYFRTVADLMAENPPPARHVGMLAMMRRIGLVPGKPFDPERLDPATRAGVLRAEREGPGIIDLIRRTRGTPTATGWTANRSAAANDFDYPTRAGNALVGLMGNDPEEALYFNNFFGSDGQALGGGRAYRLHFPADALPQTDALGFWSLTLYDARRFQFVENPIGRYAIGSRDSLLRNPDGSIDIYVQPQDPGGQASRNWLPSPATGDFKLTLRIYMPTAPMVAAYRQSTLPVPPVIPVDAGRSRTD